mmetsp:Transcript_4318/g.10242  ORF Transcript_4318/g.10242 Transcript_4318/m.10242 type:complete len:211 (+) Transcript_4318:325-957(+)
MIIIQALLVSRSVGQAQQPTHIGRTSRLRTGSPAAAAAAAVAGVVCTLGKGCLRSALLRGKGGRGGHGELHGLPILAEDLGHPIGLVQAHELGHHGTVTQAPHVLVQALVPGWGHLADLPALESRQLQAALRTVEFGGEAPAGLGCAEVEECIAEVAAILEVDGHIDKVHGVPVASILKPLEECVLGVLVRNVAEHGSGRPRWQDCLDGL